MLCKDQAIKDATKQAALTVVNRSLVKDAQASVWDVPIKDRLHGTKERNIIRYVEKYIHSGRVGQQARLQSTSG